jgi:hypothetical protein
LNPLAERVCFSQVADWRSATPRLEAQMERLAKRAL